MRWQDGFSPNDATCPEICMFISYSLELIVAMKWPFNSEIGGANGKRILKIEENNLISIDCLILYQPLMKQRFACEGEGR